MVDAAVRPWELPGNTRRDCETHRAQLLSLLGGTALACGFLSVGLVAPALVAVPLGVAVWRMSEHDLRAMRRGRMDPDGRRGTARAQAWAAVGVVASLFCWAPLACWFLLRS
jgi:uncharacterized membrane protein YccF (DUF307 family)